MIDKALALVAEREGIDLANLSLAAGTTNDYPLSGKLAYSFKVIDTTTDNLYAMSLDADGAEVDPEELLAAEEAAYTDKYGSLEAEPSSTSSPPPLPTSPWMSLSA